MPPLPISSLTIVVILFVSGCVSLGGGGVIIETFEPDFTSVFNDEPVTFRVKIRNTGSFPSPEGKVQILGLEEWNPVSGACSYKELIAPQPPQTTGESKVCSFTLKAPSVPQGLPVTYQPAARLSYSYTSQSLKTVTIGNQQEMKRLENTGGPLATETSFQSASPITITINIKGPIRVFDNNIKFPLDITLVNNGGGTVCIRDYTSCRDNTNWNTFTITTKLGATPVEECSKAVTLFKGQSLSFTCQVPTGALPQTGIIKKTIVVESSYGYFFDTLTSVTVNWRATGF